jgi:histidine kinase-like protein
MSRVRRRWGIDVADWSHTKSWFGDPCAVAGARRFVRVCLTPRHSEHTVDDVTLVVSELATNAVVHASSAFSVTLANRRGSLLLTVRDDSPARPMIGRRSVFALDGRGLKLVEAHSAAWGSSPAVDGGKTVWASFDGGVQAATRRAYGEGTGEAVR